MKPDTNTLDFIKEDIRQVWSDSRQKRMCRTTLFITILGAMGTIGFALIALIQAGQPEQWHKWILLGTLIPLFLLSVGIVMTIYKVRAINIRTGYLEAVSYYIRRGLEIRHFGGWQNALRAARICANLAYISPEGTAPCGRCEKEYCSSIAERTAELNNRTAQTWRREIMKSFTVLVAIVYGVLYAAVGGSVIAAGIITFGRQKESWNADVYWGAGIFAGCVVLAVVLGLCRRVKAFRSTVAGACYVMLAAGGLALLVAASYKLARIEKPLGVINIFALGGGLLFITGLGILLCDQVYKARKGEYSAETYYQAWRRRFEVCPLMTGSNIYKAGQKPGAGTYMCLKYGCQTPQEISNGDCELNRCKNCNGIYFYETLPAGPQGKTVAKED